MHLCVCAIWTAFDPCNLFIEVIATACEQSLTRWEVGRWWKGEQFAPFVDLAGQLGKWVIVRERDMWETMALTHVSHSSKLQPPTTLLLTCLPLIPAELYPLPFHSRAPDVSGGTFHKENRASHRFQTVMVSSCPDPSTEETHRVRLLAAIPIRCSPPFLFCV